MFDTELRLEKEKSNTATKKLEDEVERHKSRAERLESELQFAQKAVHESKHSKNDAQAPIGSEQYFDIAEDECHECLPPFVEYQEDNQEWDEYDEDDDEDWDEYEVENTVPNILLEPTQKPIASTANTAEDKNFGPSESQRSRDRSDASSAGGNTASTIAGTSGVGTVATVASGKFPKSSTKSSNGVMDSTAFPEMVATKT